jgi:acyl carrier protein
VATVVDRVKAVISIQMRHHTDGSPVADDTILFRGGLNLDSMAVFELISLTEAEFQIEYREEDLREEHFRTPRALASLLESLGAV